MKCEICHKADAAKAIRREGADGEEDELYVCEACARAERQRRQRKSSRTRKVTGLNGGVEMSVTEISGDGDGGGEPPPIVGAILNAFQDMVNDLERASKGGEEKKDERKLVEIGADGAAAAVEQRQVDVVLVRPLRDALLRGVFLAHFFCLRLTIYSL